MAVNIKSNDLIPLFTEGIYNNDEILHQLSSQLIEPKELEDNLNGGVTWEAEDWIKKHDSSIQDDLRKLTENITHISHKTFCDSLHNSIIDAKKLLSEKFKRDFNPSQDAVVLVEGTKSNKWVAEIAYHKYGFVPNRCYRLGEKDARSFRDYAIQNQDAVSKALKDKVVVLFDDGSYSGTQLHDHVQNLLDIAQKYKFGLKGICVVVPYMTTLAENKLKQIGTQLKKAKNAIPVIVASHTKIKTLEDLENKGTLQKIWGKGVLKTRNLAALGLIWFPHKVPNSESFGGTALVNRSVYDLNGNSLGNFQGTIIPDILPLYKSH